MSLGKPEDKPAPSLPVDPFADAPVKTVVTPWQSSQRILEAKGVPFAAGASAIFDPATSTLRVTNTAMHMDLVERVIDELREEKTRGVALSLQLIQMPMVTALEVAASIGGNADQAPQLQKLMASKDANVKPVGTLYYESRSGEKVVSESVLNYEYLADVTTNEKGERKLEIKSRPVGMRAESTAVLDSEKKEVDLEISLGFDTALPSVSEPTVTLSADGRRVKQRRTTFHAQTVASTLSMNFGDTRLLGIWQPVGTKQSEGTRWLAFVTASEVTPEEEPLYDTGDLEKLAAPKGMALFESSVPLSCATNAIPPDFEQQHTLRLYLESRGVSFPKGSYLMSGDHGQVVACNLLSNLELIAGILEELGSRCPKRLAFTVHTFQASGNIVREALARARRPGQRRHALDSLFAQVATGNAAGLGSLQILSKSGALCTVSSSHEHAALGGFHLDNQGRSTLQSKMSPLGLELEVTPVSQPDGRSVDVGVGYKHTKNPTSTRLEHLYGKPEDNAGSYTASMETTPMIQLSTSMRMTCGATHVLGVWPVVDQEQLGTEDLLEIAFITCDSAWVTNDHPMKPEHPTEDKLDSNGMRTRAYQIPPDFLHMNAEPSYPLADLSPKSKPRPVTEKTAVEILLAQGIPFPPGSSARYFVERGELVVINTPSNLDLIEAFRGCSHHGPRAMTSIFHLAEVPGTLARELMRDAQRHPDARPELERLLAAAKQNRAQIRQVWQGASTSGSMTTIKEGADRAQTTRLGFNDKGIPVLTEVKRKVGAHLEYDTVVGPDGSLLDVNLSLEHHSSPPTDHPIIVDHPGLGGRAKLPVSDFHVSKVSGTFSTMDGATTLVSAWRPDGTGKDLMHLLFMTTHFVPRGD